MGNERVPAAGGDRLIPAPDPIARDYLLLGLRLGKLLPGLVDSYFGPAGLKDQVAGEAPRPPIRLREQASLLQSRLSKEVTQPDRLRWLRAQLVSLEAQAMTLAGDPLPYSDSVACLFDIVPERPSEAVFDAAADDLARLLPAGTIGGETVSERMVAWESRFAVDPARLPAVVEWLVGEVRDRTDRLMGLPVGERVEFAYVSGRPWGIHVEYMGGGRTRVDIDTDVPITPAGLIHMAAHECYPGRHTERAWREQRILEEMGRLEAGISLLNTPEAVISEGLASLGELVVASDDETGRMLIELYERSGLAVAADPAAAREAAETQVRIRRAATSLGSVTASAAFMLHADGVPRDEVALYLRHRLLTTPDRAEQQVKLIEDPIFRTQVLAGDEGERLLHRWFELGPTSERVDQLGRFMREQVTPGALTRELSSIGFGEGSW